MHSHRLHPDLLQVFRLLNQRADIRLRIAAPRDKTVVYSGRMHTTHGKGKAWELLAQAKAQNPARFDYVTLAERLQQLHVVALGETLYDHAMRLEKTFRRDAGLDSVSEQVLWKALSGI